MRGERAARRVEAEQQQHELAVDVAGGARAEPAAGQRARRKPEQRADEAGVDAAKLVAVDRADVGEELHGVVGARLEPLGVELEDARLAGCERRRLAGERVAAPCSAMFALERRVLLAISDKRSVHICVTHRLYLSYCATWFLNKKSKYTVRKSLT